MSTLDQLVNGQIQTAPINIDAMTQEELAQAALHPALHADVKMYASLLHSAHHARKDGNITRALALETRADYTYSAHIPTHLQW